MARVSIAIGLILLVFGQALFLLGTFHALTGVAVIALLILMAVFAVRYAHVTITRPPKSLLAILVGGSILVFFQALYPPTGWDATMYHLTYARIFAEEGTLPYLGHLRYPVFPQLNEMWFTAALLVANDVTAQLTQWLCFVVTAVAIASVLRTFGSPHAAVLAAAIWLAVPINSYLASNAYVECGLAMAAMLAFVSWLQWRATEHPKWAFLTGAFAGMAAATKYHGLFFVAWFGVAMLIVASRRRIRDVALFALAVILVAGPWYARIAAWTGNPIFPYGESLFGANDWNLHLDASLQPTRFFEAPTVRAWLINNIYNVRPWIYLLTPLAAAGAFFDRRVRFLFFAALAYIAVFWRYDSRFLIVIIPLLAIAAATLIERIPRLGLASAFLVLFPVTIWNAKILLRDFGAPPRTAAQRDAFLAARIWPYEALRFLERTAGGKRTIYVYEGENASYFWRGRFLGDHFGPYRYELLLPLAGKPEHLAQALRSFGAEYVIVQRDFENFPRARPFELVYSSARAEVYRIGSGQ